MIYARVNKDYSTLKMWSSIATCLQAHYTGSFLLELLTLLSLLLVCHCYPLFILRHMLIGADVIEVQRLS